MHREFFTGNRRNEGTGAVYLGLFHALFQYSLVETFQGSLYRTVYTIVTHFLVDNCITCIVVSLHIPPHIPHHSNNLRLAPDNFNHFLNENVVFRALILTLFYDLGRLL